MTTINDTTKATLLLLANLSFTRYKANSKAGWLANEAKLTIQTAPELYEKINTLAWPSKQAASQCFYYLKNPHSLWAHLPYDLCVDCTGNITSENKKPNSGIEYELKGISPVASVQAVKGEFNYEWADHGSAWQASSLMRSSKNFIQK